MQRISLDKFDCFRYATAGFATSVVDEYGLRCQLPARPTPQASNPILIHQHVSLLPASFRLHRTVTPLRFATPSGWGGIFNR
jgi:hypothetical protein